MKPITLTKSTMIKTSLWSFIIVAGVVWSISVYAGDIQSRVSSLEEFKNTGNRYTKQDAQRDNDKTDAKLDQIINLLLNK